MASLGTYYGKPIDENMDKNDLLNIIEFLFKYDISPDFACNACETTHRLSDHYNKKTSTSFSCSAMMCYEMIYRGSKFCERHFDFVSKPEDRKDYLRLCNCGVPCKCDAPIKQLNP